MSGTILHQYSDGKFTCTLYTDGQFSVNGKSQPWYKDGQTGKPWLVKKYQQFKSLCKLAIREGDFDP
jgi:hypothetical protein